MDDFAPQQPMNTMPQKSLKPYAVPQRQLFTTACFFGIALLLYILGNNIVSLILVNNPAFYNRYLNDELFTTVVTMGHSLFNVFLPFVLVYLFMRKRKYVSDLPLGGVYDPVNAVLLVFAGWGFCYVANYVSSFLNIFLSAFGVESYALTTQMDSLANEITPLTAVLQIIGYAVMPALFEEFAYRGLVLQSLRRYGDGFAIVVSAALFGLMHANLMQVPFAFIVGLVLGYCTVVSGSMWGGIAIHFANNFISVLQSIFITAYGEHAGLLIMSVMIYALILIGFVCGLVYISRNRAFFKLPRSRFRYMPHKGLLVFAAPSVLFACFYFIYATLMDIIGFSEWLSEGLSNLFFFG